MQSGRKSRTSAQRLQGSGTVEAAKNSEKGVQGAGSEVFFYEKDARENPAASFVQARDGNRTRDLLLGKET